MFEAVRLNSIATVIQTIDKEIKTICTIPTYYINDLGIAEVIAKTLNENQKYKIILDV